MSTLHEYRERLDARSRDHARLLLVERRISAARLLTIAALVILIWSAVRGGTRPWFALAPAAIFAALAVWHDRVVQKRQRLRRAMTFYEHGIARIEDRWQAHGRTGIEFLDETHLYARDLDIFGPASLFQLLSRARTHLGESTLAGWLKTPADLTSLRQRHAAVAELRDCLDFREALAIAGGAEIDTTRLIPWAEAARATPGLWVRAAAMVLSVAIIASGAWWLAGHAGGPFLAFVLAKMLLTRPSRSSVAQSVRGVEAPLAQLDVLSDTLALIEQRTPQSERLIALRRDTIAGNVTPSEAIRRLKRLADMLEWRRNAFFAPISATLSWPLHLAAAVDAWRAQFGPHVARWLVAVGEYEALGSLAAYHLEHPDDPFPDLRSDGPATFVGVKLGHPLVPADRMIRNDVALASDVRLLIVSGSNMSGKSTLLRTVGINAVMAMAGAPVRAEHLTMTALAVGATLHVHDSLQQGQSRFFAEIIRVRAIVDLLDRTPAPLFLLDELFQGTNSHDRRTGADAVLLHLIQHGAIGLATTHDLGITTIADESGGRIRNVHLEDRLNDGELAFDYTVRPGVVTHSNALALMRAVGLPTGS